MSTPETDAETMRDEWDHVDSDFGPFGPSDSVPADFARKLERERDEARGQRDRLAEALRMITTFDFSNAIMVTELEEAIDVAWGSITTDVRYEMCRDSFSIGFRMGANSFLENAESTRAENKP